MTIFTPAVWTDQVVLVLRSARERPLIRLAVGTPARLITRGTFEYGWLRRNSRRLGPKSNGVYNDNKRVTLHTDCIHYDFVIRILHRATKLGLERVGGWHRISVSRCFDCDCLRQKHSLTLRVQDNCVLMTSFASDFKASCTSALLSFVVCSLIFFARRSIVSHVASHVFISNTST